MSPALESDLSVYRNNTAVEGKDCPDRPGLWFYQIVRPDGSWNMRKCGAQMVCAVPSRPEDTSLAVENPMKGHPRFLLYLPRDSSHFELVDGDRIKWFLLIEDRDNPEGM